MMDKSRYQKKAQAAKSRQETEQKQSVEENAQKTPTPISESKPVKENESVSKKASEKTTQSENGGFFVSQDAAEKLRLTMLQQSEMMKQIAEMFGNESSDGNELELEEVPEVKPKAFSGSKMTPKPETDEESDEESDAEPDAEPEYKPKHSMKPKPQVNSPMPNVTVEDEESETESGWKLDRVYEFCDSRTGELLYVRNDDFWTAYQFAGENYRRIWVWLHDGRFVREASPSEVNEIYPGLFLSKG